MYQMLEQASQKQSNPIDLLKQVTEKYTPEQMQNFYNIAQSIGFPSDILTQIQEQMK